MRLLLDTHTLLWWMTDDDSLSRAAGSLIAAKENHLVVSAVSAWEIATKFRRGRLPAAADFVKSFASDLSDEGVEILAVNVDHGLRAGLLPGSHKDPFDRMLIAQALAEDIAIVSDDQAFDQYGVRRLW